MVEMVVNFASRVCNVFLDQCQACRWWLAL